MSWRRSLAVGFSVVALATVSALWFPPPSAQSPPATTMDTATSDNARQMLDEGRRVFRYETFGDEAYWGETLKLHRAIAGAKLGGVGPGVSPKTAFHVENRPFYATEDGKGQAAMELFG